LVNNRRAYECCGLGTVALDHVKTPSGSKKDMLGGSAAHFAMAARLFTDVHLVAVVGKDFPRKHLEFLKRKGIDLSSLMISNGKTFRWRGNIKKGFEYGVDISHGIRGLTNLCARVKRTSKKLAQYFLGQF